MAQQRFLDTAAVGRRTEEAGEILGAYISTNPRMELNRTAEAKQAPKGGGAIDPTR